MSNETGTQRLDGLTRRAEAGDSAAMQALVAYFSSAHRYDDATVWLRRLVDAGHPGAMLQLGGQLLIGMGVPAAPAEGVRLVTVAAQKGVVPAFALLAASAAAGLGCKQDFGAALTLLGRAARHDFPPAVTQVAALNAAGLGTPVALAASAATKGKRRVLSEDPLVVAFDNFLEPSLCAYMIARSQGRLEPAKVFDWETGASSMLDGRSATSAAFAFFDTDVISWLIRTRIAATMGVPLGHLEQTTVIHYDPGQHYAPHFDFIESHEQKAQDEIARYGQRERTFLIYLNEDYADGATEFPLLGISHKGARGSALGFVSVSAAGDLDRRTVHAGLPPATGQKWLLSQWIRNRDQGVQ